MGDHAAQSLLSAAVALGKYPHEIAAEMTDEQIWLVAGFVALKESS